MTSPPSLAHGHVSAESINTTFAENYRGLQAGVITGQVNAEFHRHDTPDYVKRGSVLEEISAKLSHPAARVALVGLGGVGKTQLAIEYAHRQRSQSPETWVLWLYASNEGRFEQGVRGILNQLKVRDRHNPKSDVFQLLRARLCDPIKGPWLLIMDNADDACVLLGSPSANQADKSANDPSWSEARLDYIPHCDHGRVLVTSRSRDAAGELVDWKNIVAVGPMDTEQAVALLNRKLDRKYDMRNVAALAQALDFIPLAMAQAAAYICQSAGRCSIQEYLEKLGQYDRSGASILDIDERNLRRDREANNSIMLTWQISFDYIRAVRPSAADLLSLMCFFDCKAISEGLLQERGNGQAKGGEERSAVNSRDSERSGKVAGNSNPDPVHEAEEYEKDLVALRCYSLVSSTTERAMIEMHRLVQVAVKKWLVAVNQFDRWASQFISNIEEAFPTSNISNWAMCQSLFPHTMAALHIEPTTRETKLQLATLLLRSASYGSAAGIYVDAEKMQERCLKIRSEMFGEKHPDTLISKGNLALTYSQQGRWKEAEKLEVE
ncbi:hypothetical protein KC343_g6624, partial [Hortaea werneckii]